MLFIKKLRLGNWWVTENAGKVCAAAYGHSRTQSSPAFFNPWKRALAGVSDAAHLFTSLDSNV